jgi:glycosyltransferase involved in cell wall biosynthesis
VRILEICTTIGPGGIQRHALDLGAWLSARGHTVAYAGAPHAWFKKNDPLYLCLRTDLVSWEGGSILKRVSALPGATLTLRRYLAAMKFDLIHAHESAPAIVARLADPLLRLPLIVTYHGSEPERVGQFAKIAQATANVVVTPGGRCGEDLAAAGLDRDKLKVIGLGVKPAAAGDKAKAALLRQSLLGDGRFLVVTVARLAHQKGIDILVDVARRVREKIPGARFAVIGDGPMRDKVSGWADAAGVSDIVHFVGESSAVGDYLAAGDAFLLTSRWEALPVTIVEAFRARLPVIASDCGGIAEIVDGSVGAVTPIGDAQAAADAVIALASDEALRRRKGDAAYARAAEPRFSPDHVHGVFERLYEETIRDFKR